MAVSSTDDIAYSQLHWYIFICCSKPRKSANKIKDYLFECHFCAFFPAQLVVGLLFLTAIASLALTLAEGRDPDNGTVLFVNPALFAASWVNIAGFAEAD